MRNPAIILEAIEAIQKQQCRDPVTDDPIDYEAVIHALKWVLGIDLTLAGHCWVDCFLGECAVDLGKEYRCNICGGIVRLDGTKPSQRKPSQRNTEHHVE